MIKPRSVTSLPYVLRELGKILGLFVNSYVLQIISKCISSISTFLDFKITETSIQANVDSKAHNLLN